MGQIGILTWYFGANYGALAQSVAMNHTIRSLGYESVMINYKPEGYWKTVLRSNLPPKRKRLRYINQTMNGIRKCVSLSKYRYFEESSKVRSASEIDAMGLDCVVLGSDAIFNMDHPLWTPLYYGVGMQAKKVAYSPSCEYLDQNTELPEDCKRSLKEMAAISVRDVNTQKLVCKNTGVSPVITLDPTFLYDFKEVKSDLEMKNYILIYSFSDWAEYRKQIKDYAKQNGLSIVVVGRQADWADYSFPEASFEEWINCFRNAKFVMTDSFHGTVFALKNQKQILLCGRPDKESKIRSLLHQLDVTIGIYQGESVEEYFQANTIDYGVTQEAIDREREKSLDYLRKALKE